MKRNYCITVCAHCGNRKGFGTDHRECSKALQASSTNRPKPTAVKSARYKTKATLDYWANIDNKEKE